MPPSVVCLGYFPDRKCLGHMRGHPICRGDSTGRRGLDKGEDVVLHYCGRMGILLDGEQHLSVSEAAKLLGKSEETARRWLRSGKLRGRKVGILHYVSEAEVKRVLRLEERAGIM